MAGLWIAAAAGVGIVGMSLGAPPPAELTPAVSSCISENAPKAEQAIASLNDATSFLVDDVCADVIAAEQNRQSAAEFQKMRDKQHQACVAQKASPGPAKQDEDDTSACAMDNIYSAYVDQSGWTIFSGVRMEKSPQATAYAAKLLLELRLAHTKR